MSSFLGLDTSNYTTSAAQFFSDGSVKQAKKLLPVKPGERGLRQSDAVFHHVGQLPEVFCELDLSEKPRAVGVSTRPRDEAGSYMPCFNVGASFGKVLAHTLGVPCYEFSHQAGHIVAALYSAKKLDLLAQRFVAFHVSGGTTEAVLVSPSEGKIIDTQIVAQTLDLNAGQLVDRVGLMLGLNFPAGAELESLALRCEENFKVQPTLKGADCCLSGVENLCVRMQQDGAEPEKIARFCLEFVAATLEEMCERVLSKCGAVSVLFAGGVMSNSIIRQRLERKFEAVFGEPSFSSDNAAGVAILAAMKAGELA